MTQRSLPQDGYAPADMDGGPFNAQTESKRTRHNMALGLRNPIVYGLDCELVPTGNDYASTDGDILISAGEAVIDGRSFYSTSDVTIPVDWSSLSSLSEMVVIVLLVSNSYFAPVIGIDFYPLAFPTDLTDYNGTPSVESETVRLACIVTSTETVMSDIANLLETSIDGVFAQPIWMYATKLNAFNGLDITREYQKYPPSNVSDYMLSTKSGSLPVVCNIGKGTNGKRPIKNLRVTGEVHKDHEATQGTFWYPSLPITVDNYIISSAVHRIGVTVIGSPSLTDIYLSSSSLSDVRHVIFDITFTMFKRYILYSGTVTYVKTNQYDADFVATDSVETITVSGGFYSQFNGGMGNILSIGCKNGASPYTLGTGSAIEVTIS